MASSRPVGRRCVNAAAIATEALLASASGFPGYSTSTALSTTWRTAGVMPPFWRSCRIGATPQWSPIGRPCAFLVVWLLIADHEQPAVVLRVDLPVRADGERRVRRADRELGEDGIHQLPVAVDLVEVAVLAVREHGAVDVDGGRVHAPFEAEGMVRRAGECSVRVALATERVRVLEAPVDLEVRRQRGDEVLLGIARIVRVAVGRADGVVVAIRARGAVMVL